jgi:hypothetical protein
VNISFHHKVALGLVALAACLIAVWRYDLRIQEPRHANFVNSLQNDLHARDELSRSIEELTKTRALIDRVAAENKVDDSVGQSIGQSFNALLMAGNAIYAGQDNPFKQLSIDTGEFFKIVDQLTKYKNKLNEFDRSFETYFQGFESSVNRWKASTQTAIASGAVVTNTIPFDELNAKMSTLEKVIPEVSIFSQKIKGLSVGIDQWVKEINDAPNVEQKQTIFSSKQYLIKGVPALLGTFKQYIANAAEHEQSNAQAIAQQIDSTAADLQAQMQDRFAAINNSIQTVVAQTKYKDEQYRKVKYVVAGLTFIAILVFFFAITMYSFRFERGLAFFRRKTFEAAQASREVSESLKDTSTLAVQNFDLANTLQQGLADVSKGFLARQNNLQHVDSLVRDTDALIKESQTNFLQIKDEFYNAEKVSEEIIHLTEALEGVAVQMTSVADRVLASGIKPKDKEGKQKTIDELKYLAGRIRFAVNATHTTLDGRAQKIEEAKSKFTAIEENMTQMTENTKQALRSLALARLDHSEEVSRINDILENARNTSRGIVTEIETLNKQINDFSVLSAHLAALHELAVKASALNTQSLLTGESAPLVEETLTSSQRMNSYVQEYFKKIFENPALKIDQTEPALPVQTNRIQTSADV